MRHLIQGGEGGGVILPVKIGGYNQTASCVSGCCPWKVGWGYGAPHDFTDNLRKASWCYATPVHIKLYKCVL